MSGVVPKIRGTIIGDPYKDSSILGSIWESPIVGNYHVWVDWLKGLRSGKFGLKGAGCFMWGFSTRVAKQNTRKSKMICASYFWSAESKSSFKCMGLKYAGLYGFLASWGLVMFKTISVLACLPSCNSWQSTKVCRT